MVRNTHEVRKREGWTLVNNVPDIFKGPTQQGRNWMSTVAIQWGAGGGPEVGSRLQPSDERVHTSAYRSGHCKLGCVDVGNDGDRMSYSK